MESEFYPCSIMSNASRVSEIFQQASVAFARLSYLTLELKLSQAQQTSNDQKANAKWTTEEINQLKEAIVRFGNDLGKIAEAIESKTLDQIKQKVNSKAFQEAGLTSVPSSLSQSTIVNDQKSPPDTAEHGRRRRSPSESNVESNTPAKRIRTEEEFFTAAQPLCKPEASSSNEARPPVSTSSGTLFVRGQVRFASLPVNTDSKGLPNQQSVGLNPNMLGTKAELEYGLLRPTEETPEDPDSRYEEYEDSSEDGENGGYYESDAASDGAEGEDDEDGAAEANEDVD